MDRSWVKTSFKLSKTDPFFVHPGIARVVDTTKIKNIAPIFFGSEKSLVGEEGGGVELVADCSTKGSIVGGDAVIAKGEEGSLRIVGLVVGEVEVTVIIVTGEDSVKETEAVADDVFAPTPLGVECKKIRFLSKS